MSSFRNLLTLVTLTSLVCGLLACAPASQEEDAAAAQAQAWTEIQQAKETLTAKRQELQELRDQIAGGAEDSGEPESEATEGEAAEGEAAGPEERLTALESEVDKLTEDFVSQLIEFINSQDLYEGQELTEIQRAAFDLKAEEDVLVAQEYIDEAGNYQKAIDIYTTSLLADPESEILLAARAHAEELRYMTEERFAAVKKGMSQEEVRATLGTPQPINIREYEDRGVTAWFYPKAEPKTAAGVYFREQRGELVVYSTDFDAVTVESEEAG